MCLQTLWKQPKIATKAITVYKLLTHSNYSPYNYFKYELNKRYRTQLESMSDDNSPFDDIAGDYKEKLCKKGKKYKSIGPGFHAAMTINRLAGHRHFKIHKCQIPKGTSYYKDGTGLIVSDKIIIKERI